MNKTEQQMKIVGWLIIGTAFVGFAAALAFAYFIVISVALGWLQ